ncbi:hypothetical protein PCP53_32365 (plasmid) [Pseudomonas aeruginosa]|uniref:hypothetical protein n=1 Tax=Pseudomonas aeruginosa TaxID=287 RepID=UPI002E29540A|nr:hypothetical protein [Pseudomonas aeruginosa]
MKQLKQLFSLGKRKPSRWLVADGVRFPWHRWEGDIDTTKALAYIAGGLAAAAAVTVSRSGLAALIGAAK